jgi:hypothetical protein
LGLGQGRHDLLIDLGEEGAEAVASAAPKQQRSIVEALPLTLHIVPTEP